MVKIKRGKLLYGNTTQRQAMTIHGGSKGLKKQEKQKVNEISIS